MINPNEENSYQFEPVESSNPARRIVGSFIAGIKFVGRQLATADLNPHEGRLRSSVMPSTYVEVPDYPPIHDNII